MKLEDISNLENLLNKDFQLKLGVVLNQGLADWLQSQRKVVYGSYCPSIIETNLPKAFIFCTLFLKSILCRWYHFHCTVSVSKFSSPIATEALNILTSHVWITQTSFLCHFTFNINILMGGFPWLNSPRASCFPHNYRQQNKPVCSL